jgi:hypothetical protein
MLGLGLCQFLVVLARIDGYQGPTFAGKLVVIRYPSDTLLRFPAAVLAFKLDLGIINNIGHTHLQERQLRHKVRSARLLVCYGARITI